MPDSKAMLVGKTKEGKCIELLYNKANRHGLIAGATGTGKTVTLQTIAENFSKEGIPVFLTDIKGDLSGIAEKGIMNEKIARRLNMLNLNAEFEKFPVSFWDVYGEQGIPIRVTISEMGPLLMSRLLNLNETQSGVLQAVFKIADDNGLLLLDLKDLRSMLDYVGKNAKEFQTSYGNITYSSIGAIQRSLLTIEQQGGDKFFGEPSLEIEDLFRKENIDGEEKGVINILSAEKLILTPKIYSSFLLWLISELFERLPEVGDIEKPKIVFFFDEAHLIFKDAPKILIEKIEQVVRLIRSKGVGIYFCTQNPLDIPESILGQLGNKIQHAMRAFTPKDQKNIKAIAGTFRQNSNINTEKAITELEVGEALVSFLDEKGIPTSVERTFIVPPRSYIGAISHEKVDFIIKNSMIYKKYGQMIDRTSAYEILKKRADEAFMEEEHKKAAEKQLEEEKQLQKEREKQIKEMERMEKRQNYKYKQQRPQQTRQESTIETFGKEIGKQIIRGMLGGIFKKNKKGWF